jgi:hypothetical protein
LTRSLIRNVTPFAVFAFLLLALTAARPSANTPPGQDSLAKLAGTWKGTCQDGGTFVVLDLQLNGNQLVGSVSIGNMHGDDEGACMLVTAPPVPEHAQKISDAHPEHDAVLFNGSKRPDGSFVRFELKQTAADKAELQLLGTPVEQHPWLLAKVQKSQ